MKQSVTAIYGAAFNPPHCGHADAIRQLLDDVARVVVVPAIAHAFHKDLIAFNDRFRLTSQLLRDHFPMDARVEISDVEARILAERGQGPVHSIDVLRRLAGSRNEACVLAIGEDNAVPEVWQCFHDHNAIEREFGVLVVRERVPIRSTRIRERLRGRIFLDRATQDWMAATCGQAVAGELIEHNLYRGD